MIGFMESNTVASDDGVSRCKCRRLNMGVRKHTLTVTSLSSRMHRRYKSVGIGRLILGLARVGIRRRSDRIVAHWGEQIH